MSIFQTHPDAVDEFDALLDEKCDREYPLHGELQCLVERAVQIAEALIRENPTDPDAHQLLGLAWYRFPASSSMRSWRCRSALMRALELDPMHRYAHQYLAYLDFDQERYGDALVHLKSLQESPPVEPDREHIALKNRELSLACRLRIDPTSDYEQELSEYSLWFQDARRREDLDDTLGCISWPHELKDCAEWLFHRGCSPDRGPLKRLLSFLLTQYPVEEFCDDRLRRILSQL